MWRRFDAMEAQLRQLEARQDLQIELVAELSSRRILAAGLCRGFSSSASVKHISAMSPRRGYA